MGEELRDTSATGKILKGLQLAELLDELNKLDLTAIRVWDEILGAVPEFSASSGILKKRGED